MSNILETIKQAARERKILKIIYIEKMVVVKAGALLNHTVLAVKTDKLMAFMHGIKIKTASADLF